VPGVERVYTALAYDTVTGRVLFELDLASEPEWSTRINDVGGWKIAVPLAWTGACDDGPGVVRTVAVLRRHRPWPWGAD
jgi:hypothetical protein